MIALLRTMSLHWVARDDIEVVLDSAPNHKPGRSNLMATVSKAPGAGRFRPDVTYLWLVSGSLHMRVKSVTRMSQDSSENQDRLLIEAHPLTPLEELDEELDRRLGRRFPMNLENPVYAPLKGAMAMPTSTTMRAMVFCLIHDFEIRELDIRYEPWKIKIRAQLMDADGATTDFYSENIHDLYVIQGLEYVRAGGRDLIRGIAPEPMNQARETPAHNEYSPRLRGAEASAARNDPNKPKYACCNNEQRGMNGGCTNCGAPCA